MNPLFYFKAFIVGVSEYPETWPSVALKPVFQS